MENNHDQDMYLFDSSFSQPPTAFSGQVFDDFLAGGTPRPTGTMSAAPLSSDDSTAIQSPASTNTLRKIIDHDKGVTPSGSDSSTRSLADSPIKQEQLTSNAAASIDARQGNWRGGGDGLTVPSSDALFGTTALTGLEDYEVSNRQMASDFDFDTAASTPRAFGNSTLSDTRALVATTSFRTSASFNCLPQLQNASPRLPAGHGRLYFGASRETSPMNTMLSPSIQSPWMKNSPSLGLEETFNGITMNGDSPGNATFSPSLQFPTSGLNFDAKELATTTSTLNRDMLSPPSTSNSPDTLSMLTVYPTSLKSRVETQIPIKLTLAPLPAGVTKLRLPTHTVSKHKFLAKPEAERSAEILELYTSLVCTSAMQDKGKRDRAFARARGEEIGPISKPSPTSPNGCSQSPRDDEEKPLNGGEVKICSGCIQRERKRASRKKQKKPGEEEMFQKDEEKRVIVFNTNEIKEWTEPAKDTPGGIPGHPGNPPASRLPKRAKQVELPMRIACYCRHQNEKLGFRVIFTIKDYTDKVVAQAMTNSIMITDDHKTHNAPPPLPTPNPSLPNTPQFPGAGVFSTAGMDVCGGQLIGPKMFKQSFSTTDLTGLQHNFNPNFPMTSSPNPFTVPSAMSSNTSAALTPRNLSRPPSPTSLSGPSKRRKQSGSGKIPAGLVMTRLDTSQPVGSSTVPNTGTRSSFGSSLMSATSERNPMQARQPAYGTSPTTPNGNHSGFISATNRSFSMENLPKQTMLSAPSSRQPSRPGSAGSNRESFATEPKMGQPSVNQLFGHLQRRPPPLIHKLVPAEGSITGGTEVTLLGNGFYQGLEVMFGDTEATTTTFWGEKCLNCITPPSLHAGTVSVVFKHEHPQYSSTQQQSQSRHPLFTYIDDQEVEMYRLALKTVGKQMQLPTEDPYSAAQQLLGAPSSSLWHSPQGGYGSARTHQHHSHLPAQGAIGLSDLEFSMLIILVYLDWVSGGLPSRVGIRSFTGTALLHLAFFLGMTHFVAGLSSRGASPNSSDENGDTHLHVAAKNGCSSIICRLRRARANHKAKGIRCFIPADVALSLRAHKVAMMTYCRNATSSTERHHASAVFVDRDVDYGLRDWESSDIDSVSSQSSVARQRSAHTPKATGVPPAHYMSPSPDSLPAQIQHFHESASWVIRHVHLSALPRMPGYEAYPMAHRLSSSAPPRPILSESLAGPEPNSPTAPPAYHNLYAEETDEVDDDGCRMNRTSALDVASEVALDHLFDAMKFPCCSQRVMRAEATIEVPIPHIRDATFSKMASRQYFLFLEIPLVMILLTSTLRTIYFDVIRTIFFGSRSSFLRRYDSLPSHFALMLEQAGAT